MTQYRRRFLLIIEFHLRKLLLLCIGGFFVGVLLSQTYKAKYEAKSVVVVVKQKPAALASSQLSDFASIAGVDFGGAANNEAVAILKSDSILRRLIEVNNLCRELLPGNTWLVPIIGNTDPDIRDCVKVLAKSRNVMEDRKAGTVTLTISWSNPDIAAQWVNSLVDMVNERMRSEAITQAEATKKILEEELGSNAVNVVSLTISRVIESNIEKIAFAKSNREFAFRVIDRAIAPKGGSMIRSIKFGLIAGVFASFFYVVYLLKRVYPSSI